MYVPNTNEITTGFKVTNLLKYQLVSLLIHLFVN